MLALTWFTTFDNWVVNFGQKKNFACFCDNDNDNDYNNEEDENGEHDWDDK